MLGEKLAKVTQVVTDAAVMESYVSDFTGRWRGRTPLVVRPADTAEVAEVMRICSEEGVPVVPQGGNTGLVGGGVPMGGEVVISLRRLDRIGAVDRAGLQVTAGAGVVLSALQKHVRSDGLDFGVDFAARESATIGGMVATNAGGERVLRYGTTRANVVGVEAVLADGRIVSRLGGLPKDNTGFELPLSGSEGTLGIITAARLRLVPLLKGRATALLGLPSMDAALSALGVLRRLESLEMAEFFLPEGLLIVCEHAGLPRPMKDDHAVYLLVECAAPTDPSDDLHEALAHVSASDIVLAADSADRHRLWTYREAHTEAINAQGVPLKLDIALPLDELPAFMDDLPSLIGGAAPYLFGHLAEGNIHVNLINAGDVTEAVLRRVAEAGGSISAEHGVGRAKAKWVHLSRSPAELAALQAIKNALDPQGLLNPGVLLPG